MDFERPQISLPLEKELLSYKIRQNVQYLDRRDLEEAVIQMSEMLVKLTYQSKTLLSYIEQLEGKLKEDP